MPGMRGSYRTNRGLIASTGRAASAGVARPTSTVGPAARGSFRPHLQRATSAAVVLRRSSHDEEAARALAMELEVSSAVGRRCSRAASASVGGGTPTCASGHKSFRGATRPASAPPPSLARARAAAPSARAAPKKDQWMTDPAEKPLVWSQMQSTRGLLAMGHVQLVTQLARGAPKDVQMFARARRKAERAAAPQPTRARRLVEPSPLTVRNAVIHATQPGAPMGAQRRRTAQGRPQPPQPQQPFLPSGDDTPHGLAEALASTRDAARSTPHSRLNAEKRLLEERLRQLEEERSATTLRMPRPPPYPPHDAAAARSCTWSHIVPGGGGVAPALDGMTAAASSAPVGGGSTCDTILARGCACGTSGSDAPISTLNQVVGPSGGRPVMTTIVLPVVSPSPFATSATSAAVETEGTVAAAARAGYDRVEAALMNAAAATEIGAETLGAEGVASESQVAVGGAPKACVGTGGEPTSGSADEEGDGGGEETMIDMAQTVVVDKKCDAGEAQHGRRGVESGAGGRQPAGQPAGGGRFDPVDGKLLNTWVQGSAVSYGQRAGTT